MLSAHINPIVSSRGRAAIIFAIWFWFCLDLVLHFNLFFLYRFAEELEIQINLCFVEGVMLLIIVIVNILRTR